MRKYFYWLICREPDTGKVFLLSGGEDEQSARNRGLECLGGIDFKIKRLPTRNLASASAQVRGLRLNSGEGLRKSSERQGHQKSLDRLKQRLQKRQMRGS